MVIGEIIILIKIIIDNLNQAFLTKRPDFDLDED